MIRKYWMRFFLAPDDGGNGGNSNTNDTAKDGANAEFVSPFANIDKALFDDTARQAIEKAETDLKNLHGQAKTASGLQSERDRLQSELQRLQNENLVTKKDPSKELTLEEELTEMYIREGLDPKQAPLAAKMQAKVLGTFESRYDKKVGSSFSPIASQVVSTQVSSAFQDVQQQDKMGMLQNPEIAQEVWDSCQNMVKAGQTVAPAVVYNLARIAYMKAMEEGRITTPLQKQASMNNQTASKFNFPGAGNFPQPPPDRQRSNGNDSLDSETAAALADTISYWNVKPKEFKGTAAPGAIRVTRGT